MTDLCFRKSLWPHVESRLQRSNQKDQLGLLCLFRWESCIGTLRMERNAGFQKVLRIPVYKTWQLYWRTKRTKEFLHGMLRGWWDLSVRWQHLELLGNAAEGFGFGYTECEVPMNPGGYWVHNSQALFLATSCLPGVYCDFKKKSPQKRFYQM